LSLSLPYQCYSYLLLLLHGHSLLVWIGCLW
jgi:hypothetical protein